MNMKEKIGYWHSIVRKCQDQGVRHLGTTDTMIDRRLKDLQYASDVWNMREFILGLDKRYNVQTIK